MKTIVTRSQPSPSLEDEPLLLGGSGRRRRNGEIRQRFIDVTTSLVREHGLANVSTRLICDEVGVKAPTLYHHFGDYAGLQAAVVENAFETYYDYWKERTSLDDPFQRVRYGWDSCISFSQQQPEVFAIVAQQNFAGDLPSQIITAHIELIQNFRAVGELRPLRYKPELAAQIFTAACLGVASMLAAQAHNLPVEPSLSGITREAVLSSLML